MMANVMHMLCLVLIPVLWLAKQSEKSGMRT